MMARYVGPPEPEDMAELSHFELAESVLNEIDLDDIGGSDRVRNIALTALAHGVLSLASMISTISNGLVVELPEGVVGPPPYPHNHTQTAEPKYDPSASVENLPRTHPPHEDD